VPTEVRVRAMNPNSVGAGAGGARPELIKVAELGRERLARRLRLWQHIEEALQRLLEAADGEPFNRRRRPVGVVHRPRRDRRNGAAVGPIRAARYNVLAHVPADLALDALHVAVPAHLADGVALALRNVVARRLCEDLLLHGAR